MSAIRDLIAAALTAAGAIRWQYTELADDLREACARAMVQPDMAEVERLAIQYGAKVALHVSGPGIYSDVETARTALLDAVRSVLAERDALIADNEPPKEAIGKLLADAMDTAAANGANSISMPDEYVEVAAWLCGIKPAPQPVGEVPMPDGDNLLCYQQGYAAGVAAGGKDAERYRAALIKLSCLGNGDRPGNSEGNEIAIAALRGEVKP